MGIPQFILLAIYFIGLVHNISRHGEPMTDRKYNGLDSLFSLTITVGLLYWGGFFS